MAPGGVGWRLLDVVVGQPPLILAPPFFSRIEFGWEFRVNLQVRTRSARIPGPSGPISSGPGGPLSHVDPRHSTPPNATSGGHLPRFARPDCAIQPVRTVPTNPSSQIYNRRERGAGCS